jgi:rod shape-determining protein MreD
MGPFRLSAMIPALSVLPFALVTAMPWSAPDWLCFALPLVTLSAVYFWSERQPGLLPAPVILVIGVLVDLITDGPLGYWAALYLLAHAIGGHLGDQVQAAGDSTSLKRFSIMLGIVAFCAWGIASLYYLRFFDPVPFIAGAMFAVGLRPIVVYLLEPLVRIVEGPRHATSLLAGGRSNV